VSTFAVIRPFGVSSTIRECTADISGQPHCLVTCHVVPRHMLGRREANLQEGDRADQPRPAHSHTHDNECRSATGHRFMIG
jgi:hypothetical protein